MEEIQFSTIGDNEEGLISLNSAPSSNVPVPAEVAKQRAAKAAFGLGSPEFSQETLADGIASGIEDQFRVQAAERLSLEMRNERVAMIKEMAANGFAEQSPEDIQAMSGAVLSVNPDTVFEDRFAEKVVTTGLFLVPSEVHDEITAEDTSEEEVQTVLDVAKDVISRKELFQKKLEEVEARFGAESFLGKAEEVAETFLPFLTWLNVRNSVGTDGGPVSAFLLGSNIREQADFLNSLPTEEAAIKFNQAVDSIAESNTLDAINFARMVLSQTSSDATLDNIFSAADIASFLPGPKAALGAARSLKLIGLRKAARDIVKSASTRNVDVGEILSNSGDVERGSIATAIKSVQSKIAEADPKGRLKDIQKQAHSLFNPERILEGANETNLGREAVTRVVGRLAESRENLLATLVDPFQVTRLTEAEETAAVVETVNRFSRQYGTTADSLIDFSHKVEPLTNTIAVDITLGKPNGTLFETSTQAQRYANLIYRLQKDSFRVEQHGLGFSIKITKDADETAQGVRVVPIDTETKTPQSLLNTFAGILQTPEETLPVFQRENRHVAVHGSQEIQRLMREAAEANIVPLKRGVLGGNKERQDLRRVLEVNRSAGQKGEPNAFFTNIQDLENGYLDILGRLPSEREAVAYFTYTQFNDLDWVTRNLNYFRELSRLGVEDVTVRLPSVNRDTGRIVGTDHPPFKGKTVDNLPFDNPEDAGIAVIDKGGKVKYYRKNSATGFLRKRMEELKEDGYKVVQVFNASERPLAGILKNGSPINFVVAKDIRFNRLGIKQIPFRPGGHVIYPQEFYTKQPKLARFGDNTFYHGDTSIFAHHTEAEARKFSEAMDKGRLLLKAENEAELSKHLGETLPYSLDEFKLLFRDRSGGLKAALNIDNPITFTRAGSRAKNSESIKRAFPNAIDETSSSHDLANRVERTFLGERNLTLDSIIEGEGNELDPLFKFEDSKLLDPMSSITRALSSVTRSRLLNDYKTSAVEKFVKEFAPILDARKIELDRDPLATLLDPKFIDGADFRQVQAAKNYRRATLNLLGVQTPLSRATNFIRGKLLNQVFNSLGQGPSDYVAEHLLYNVKDPFTYLRNVAFHSKLGLFNPVQLFLQSQTLTHVIGVAGAKNGMKGLAGATLMRYSILNKNPSVVEALARKAEAFGWKREEWLEARAEALRSGIHNIAGEVAWRADVLEPKLFENAGKKFLNKGTIFFNEGERLVRLTAWSTAYTEWRIANPGATLTNRARASILRRQNDLSANMTIASNASWQSGPLSAATQFLGYQTRLLEQFVGKRLTIEEKTRAFATYSAMYGVPVASTAVGGVWPFYQDIRQELLERGIQFDDNALEAVMDGIPAVTIEALTGADVNFSERFGPSGINLIKDATNGDKSAIEIVLGASGSIGGDILGSLQPGWQAISDVFEEGNDKYPLVPEDFINATSNISSVNNAVKMWYALNTGKYITKNQINLGEVSTTEAILMGVAGLTPQRFEDAFLRLDSVKSMDEGRKAAAKEFIKFMRLGMRAESSEDRIRYFTAAKRYLVLGDFQPHEHASLLSQAFKDQGFYENMQWEFIDKAPESQREDRLKALIEQGKNKQ